MLSLSCYQSAIYYPIREDPSKLEMSFDLGHYQPSLRSRYHAPPRTSDPSVTPTNTSNTSSPTPSPIYQSIFLDKGRCEASWTWKRIDPSKVLLVKWWRQFSHEVSHFSRVVPFIRFIQGKNMGLFVVIDGVLKLSCCCNYG